MEIRTGPHAKSRKHAQTAKCGLNAVAFSPDGKTIATGSDDYTVALWNVSTFREVARFQHTVRPRFLAFSPKGEALIAGDSRDSDVMKMWRAPSLGDISSKAQPAAVNARPSARAAAIPGPLWVLTNHVVLPVPAAKPRRPIPDRDPKTPANLIDLSSFYNASLEEAWQDSGSPRSENNLAGLPRGWRKLGGVEWDIRGIIQLASLALDESAIFLPDAVPGIPINRACARLHFLHGLGWGNVPTGLAAGDYIIHYQDGQKNRIPLRVGYELVDWWGSPGALLTLAPNAAVAWEGSNPQSRSAGMNVRILRLTWENPRPAVPITRVDFLSAHEEPAPFLIAVTAEETL